MLSPPVPDYVAPRQRSAGQQVAPQPAQREAGIDDVLHEEHITAGEIRIEVLHDADDAARLRRAPVRRDGHEVDLDRQIDVPRQVESRGRP